MTTLDLARGELGQHEYPPNSNNTPYGIWYGFNKVPWCAIFVSWCFHHAGVGDRYRFASVAASINWAKKNGIWRVGGTPQPGWVACKLYTSTTGHTGLVESPLGGYTDSIEGNTSSADDRNGGVVMRRRRSTSWWNGWIELPLAPAGGPAPTPPPAPPSHSHDQPVVKFAADGPHRGYVHGAVRRPTGVWVWQTNYSQVFWEVKDIQQHMRNQGHNIGVDGVGGPDTRNQLIAYQRHRGLVGDAVVGPATWARLHG